MPELPGRPDVDQLRRQARELQRAAAEREPSAVARLSAVSQQKSLSAAQLAVAREYGFVSWPALRAEAERRRRAAEPSDAFEERWSFGGLDPVPSRECGWVELRGRDGSKTRLTRSVRAAVQPGHVVQVPGSPAERELSDRALEAIRVLFTGDREDLEGACSRALARAAELRRSGELPAVSQVARELAQLCEALAGQRPLAGVPRGWSSMIGARGQADGASLHRDIAADLPPVGNMAVRVDSLVSEARSWHLCLRAKVSEWNHSDPHWSAMPVHAEDDRGGRYLTESGNVGTRGYAELALRFLPRLDPLARALTLTFTAAGEQVALEIRL
jgi:hypothetical protein